MGAGGQQAKLTNTQAPCPVLPFARWLGLAGLGGRLRVYLGLPVNPSGRPAQSSPWVGSLFSSWR